MKTIAYYIVLLGSCLICSNSSEAQTLYTDPEYPTPNAPVTIYFNSTGTPLENYSGDVYTHTGVTVNGTQWQYVIGSWGNNSNQPKLTKVGAKLYKLDMNPSIRSFYGVPASGNISEMCFVFRSADGGTQTADLFYPVFPDELGIVILQPDGSDFLILENDSIVISAISPLADQMSLYLNGSEIMTVADITLDTVILAESFGSYWDEQWVKIIASNSEGSVADSFSYRPIQHPEIADLPSGITDGINYLDGNTVILALFAPLKKFVFALGEFNNWEVNDASYMKQTPDGARFWLEISGLNPGQEYTYQYNVEDRMLVGDPYCEKVLDPWNDPYINNQTYPNLKPYPTGFGQGIVSVLQTNQENYAWQQESYTPPAVTDLVIYELLLRDFTAAHTFLSLIDTLEYFKRLGINAIELMPVNEFEGNISWGYNPNYYFAVDKYYGPKNTLKQFVDACHAEGIAVILDVVYNHSFGTSPYVMMYWDNNANRPAANSPFYNQEPKHDYNVGYDMNHESPMTKQYISRALKFWLEEFRVDGFRFDLSKGFTQKNTLGNVGLWGQYDQTRIDILRQYADSIYAVKENAFVILEHFADNSEEKVLASDGFLIWGNMNYNYCEASMGYTENSNLNWGSYKARGWTEPNLVTYMESHDEERMMYKNIAYGASSGSGYDIKDTTTGLKRIPLAAAFFLTIPGPKMIWQFGELGYDYSIDFNGRTGPKPIRWDYYEDYRRKLLFNQFASLIALKKNYETFRTTNYSLNVAGAQKQIYLNHADMNAAIIGNFKVTPATAALNFQHTGMWYDYFSGDSLEVITASLDIELAEGEFRIYTDKKLETPQIGLGVEDYPAIQGCIRSVYPNPSAKAFNLQIHLPDRQPIQLLIYNQTGSVINRVFEGPLEAGAHILVWDGLDESGNRVAEGLYFGVLIVDGRQEVVKLSLN